MVLYVFASVVASIFIAVGVLIVFKEGDWTMLTLTGAGTVVALALPMYLKLEIGESGFTYRNLTTNCSVEFADIESAYFETGEQLSTSNSGSACAAGR